MADSFDEVLGEPYSIVRNFASSESEQQVATLRGLKEVQDYIAAHAEDPPTGFIIAAVIKTLEHSMNDDKGSSGDGN